MLTKGDDPAAEEPEPPAEIPSAEDDVTAAQAARVATMEPAAPTSPTSSVTQKLADDAGDPQPAAPTSPASLSLESAQVDGDPRPDPHEYPQHLRLPLTLAYCSIVAFNVAFCMGLRGPALLRIAEQIDLISLPADGGSAAEVDLSQLTEMGVANMAFTGTSAVFSVFITGAVVDRMPKFHYLTFTMCMLLAFLSLSVIWIDSAWQLIFICALMGVCLSAIMPLLAALVSPHSLLPPQCIWLRLAPRLPGAGDASDFKLCLHLSLTKNCFSRLLTEPHASNCVLEMTDVGLQRECSARDARI